MRYDLIYITRWRIQLAAECSNAQEHSWSAKGQEVAVILL